jgi:hypothetical protein
MTSASDPTHVILTLTKATTTKSFVNKIFMTLRFQSQITVAQNLFTAESA